MPIKSYFLGCPIWSNRDWVGSLYSRRAKPADFLGEYSSVFNTIEGGNTFYGLPRTETIELWRQTIPAEFRFCFKFPQTISHEKQLRDVWREVDTFLDALLPLHDQIGQLFLQLPPTFAPDQLGDLDVFLRGLPCDYHYAVEVRHPAFSAGTGADRGLNHMLRHHHANRAYFQTETLHSIESADSSIREAQQKKPNLTTILKATGQRPFVRFCGHNQVAPNRPALTKLARTTAQWLKKGRTPFIFLHTPDDREVPALCRLFHQLLDKAVDDRIDIGELPPFHGESEPVQLTLF